MSIDKDKEFDLLVRSMMENAEEEVPSGIWENIAGKLDGNSTPVVLWWRRPLWAVAAAAVLVAGVVATLKLVPSGTTSGNLVADKVEIVSKGETRESPVSLPELVLKEIARKKDAPPSSFEAFLDDIVEDAELRQRLTSAVLMLSGKASTAPKRRHVDMPL